MANELQIWSIDGSSAKATPITPRDRTETERRLEDILVQEPAMLMPGLTLVGRQTPVTGGNLDLLGVDRDGRLIVFELKRGALTRDAISQVIDYASDLETRDHASLIAHIAEQSGKLGIDRIEDFEEWYDQRFAEQNLKPIRMALVGLGADDGSGRMVKFLAERGVEIELLTFDAFEYEGSVLLARRVEQERVAPERTLARSARIADRIRDNEKRIKGMEIPFWDDSLACFRGVGDVSEYVRTNGYAFGLRTLRLPDQETSFSVHQMVQAVDRGKIRVTFYPIAVHLCEAEFAEANKSIHFEQALPSNAPRTTKVNRQWYCVLDEAQWEEHKGALVGLASSVCTAWDDARRQVRSERDASLEE